MALRLVGARDDHVQTKNARAALYRLSALVGRKLDAPGALRPAEAPAWLHSLSAPSPAR